MSMITLFDWSFHDFFAYMVIGSFLAVFAGVMMHGWLRRRNKKNRK